MAMFDLVSFTIGLLLGMIIMLLLIWIAYYTRTFAFTYCPTQARACGAADYFTDPGDGLANYPQITVADILFLNDQNEMFYKRIPRTTDCITESNQIVFMKFPQYCSFSSIGGITGTWKQTAFNSNMYRPDGFTGPTITTDGSCNPSPGSPVLSGVPLLRWDPNPVS